MPGADGEHQGACTGYWKDLPAPEGGTTKGIEVECPDGETYHVLNEDPEEALDTLGEEVLDPDCNDGSQKCEVTWDANIKNFPDS